MNNKDMPIDQPDTSIEAPPNILQVEAIPFFKIANKKAGRSKDCTMGELLSCPFCGGKGEMRHTKHAHYIQCLGCYAETYHCRQNGKENAIKAWNHRVVPNRALHN